LNVDEGHLSKLLKSHNVKVLSSQEVRETLQGKDVAMVDKNTKQILKVFPSLSSAARYIKEKDNVAAGEKAISANIGRVANGKRKSAHNYFWKYI
jgi:hypothetical protein